MPTIHTAIKDRASIELVAYYSTMADYYPSCEMQTKDWFVRHVQKDWVIFDIGANIGYYSILFSQLAVEGKVHAFEPTATYDMLLQNLAHNCAHNVTPHNLALGAVTGRCEDSIFRLWGQEAEKQLYEFSTVDDFVTSQGITRLDAIKLDVDSFELEVLQGAVATLKNFNPFLMIEVSAETLGKRNINVGELFARLAEHGYTTIEIYDTENFLLKRGHTQATAGDAPQESLSIAGQRIVSAPYKRLVKAFVGSPWVKFGFAIGRMKRIKRMLSQK